MSMIDTDMVRSALSSAAMASGAPTEFFDILIPVDDGRSEGPLKIGEMFGSDIIQHPDVPDGQMYIKRRPAENYAPQSMIADLQETRHLLIELKDPKGRWSDKEVIIDSTLEIVDGEIQAQQQLIQKGPKS